MCRVRLHYGRSERTDRDHRENALQRMQRFCRRRSGRSSVKPNGLQFLPPPNPRHLPRPSQGTERTGPTDVRFGRRCSICCLHSSGLEILLDINAVLKNLLSILDQLWGKPRTPCYADLAAMKSAFPQGGIASAHDIQDKPQVGGGSPHVPH